MVVLAASILLLMVTWVLLKRSGARGSDEGEQGSRSVDRELNGIWIGCGAPRSALNFELSGKYGEGSYGNGEGIVCILLNKYLL
jgi:hypothetical protein